jgi:pyridoxal phosphate enzyme (YggS family)
MHRNFSRKPSCCPTRSSGTTLARCSQVRRVDAPVGIQSESGPASNPPTTGRCKALARIPNLWCVSSVDSLAKAQLLDKARGEKIKADPTISKLNVHVQVNTSGEENKSGCTPGDEVVSLCRAIVKDCPNLHLLGLMTIGAIARSVATTAEGGNEDFRVLVEQRDLVAKDLGIDANELELSMGMSEDFEGAIAMGSSEVRIGSTIFGQRPPKSEAKVVV